MVTLPWFSDVASDWQAALLAANQKLHLKIMVSYPCFLSKNSVSSTNSSQIVEVTVLQHHCIARTKMIEIDLSQYILIHRGRVTHLWVSKDHHQTSVQIMALCQFVLNHYLNQCWLIVNWTLGNNNFHPGKYIWKCLLRSGGHLVSASHWVSHQ